MRDIHVTSVRFPTCARKECLVYVCGMFLAPPDLASSTSSSFYHAFIWLLQKRARYLLMKSVPSLLMIHILYSCKPLSQILDISVSVPISSITVHGRDNSFSYADLQQMFIPLKSAIMFPIFLLTSKGSSSKKSELLPVSSFQCYLLTWAKVACVTGTSTFLYVRISRVVVTAISALLSHVLFQSMYF